MIASDQVARLLYCSCEMGTVHICKLSGVDPLAWLTDVLQRIVSGRTKNQELCTLLPWNWRPPSTAAA